MVIESSNHRVMPSQDREVPNGAASDEFVSFRVFMAFLGALRLFGVYEKNSQQVCSRVEGRMTAEHVFITRSKAHRRGVVVAPAEVH